MSTKLMKGNEALAEAAIQAGCNAYFGYPITPQSEVLEYLAREMPQKGRNRITGRKRSGQHQYGVWRVGRRVQGHDLVILTWYQPDAGGNQLPRRCRTPMPDRKR